MELIKSLKALGDDTRLRIVNILSQYELQVNEIVDVLDMGQPRISRHLKILADHDLLTARRDGLWAYYSVARGNGHSALIDTIIQHLSADPDPHYRNDLNRAAQVLDERKNRTRSFFNTIAGEWEDLKKNIFGDFDIVRAILDELPAITSIADLGCGTGDLIPALRDRASCVIGVDSSPAMIELARKKLSALGDAVDLRLGELEHLPIGNGEVDAVIINMVLHHVSQPPAALREAYRIVKRGGLCIITDFEKHADEHVRQAYGDRWLGFDREQISSWSKDAGFVVEKTNRFPVRGGLSIQCFVNRSTVVSN